MALLAEASLFPGPLLGKLVREGEPAGWSGSSASGLLMRRALVRSRRVCSCKEKRGMKRAAADQRHRRSRSRGRFAAPAESGNGPSLPPPRAAGPRFAARTTKRGALTASREARYAPLLHRVCLWWAGALVQSPRPFRAVGTLFVAGPWSPFVTVACLSRCAPVSWLRGYPMFRVPVLVNVRINHKISLCLSLVGVSLVCRNIERALEVLNSTCDLT